MVAYPAWSCIIDVMGRTAAAGGYRNETLRFGFGVPVYPVDVNFDRTVFHFDFNQEKIEDILRRFGRDVLIDFDQDNASFSLESRSPELTVADVIAEFGLETMDAYIARARKTIQNERQ